MSPCRKGLTSREQARGHSLVILRGVRFEISDGLGLGDLGFEAAQPLYLGLQLAYAISSTHPAPGSDVSGIDGLGPFEGGKRAIQETVASVDQPQVVEQDVVVGG